jgi:hypothetical protein
MGFRRIKRRGEGEEGDGAHMLVSYQIKYCLCSTPNLTKAATINLERRE